MLELIHSPYLKAALIFFLILFLFALFFSDEIIAFVLEYLLLYKYTTLFVIVFLAGFCVPIPNNILLMAIGALSIQGEFNFWYALLVGSVANMIGDVLAVLIFRKWGHRMLRDKFVEQYSFFLRLEEFFQRHVNISIFVSRIIGLFGTPVNFLSGYMKVSVLRFAIMDYLGNLAFVFLFLWIGYKVGDRWVNVSDFVSTAMSVLAIALLFSIVTFLYKTRKKPKASQVLP